ncbi:MAG: 4-hydroxy-3-methylbut-2-en-1-yl diphosphate synthase, partial [Peptococcaceae bacterium]|nr:4-hydroxy-3-methylbut-2-en-1-yl diphosphate synthase [Peptococcaceae bacterium]
EAKEADLGIAGGKGAGIIFRKGEIVRKCREDELLDAFKAELQALLAE